MIYFSLILPGVPESELTLLVSLNPINNNDKLSILPGNWLHLSMKQSNPHVMRLKYY